MDDRQRLAWDSGWRSNVIAHTAWPVVAALLRNDPSMRGVLFCAVGAGEEAWDRAPPTPTSGTTRLRTERERYPFARGDFVYLDVRGGVARQPTDRLEMTARFAAVAEPRVIREFGLFGGDATVAPDSGYLINYVIHPRLELRAGSTLTRRVRFTLRPGVGTPGGDWVSLPTHWLLKESPLLLDGVGDTYATVLAGAEVKTIGALAEIEPARLARAIPLAKAVELRAKARLTVRTAAALASVSGTDQRTAWEVITAPLPPRGRADEVSVAAAETLREQMFILQLGLDARYLKQVTVGELARKREP